MKKKRKRQRQKPTSKGHRQVSRVLRKLGLSVIDEFYLENLPYDIYIKELNLIIEYYGDRWHYPKNTYGPEDWDKVKKRYVWEKWEKDAFKIETAKECGYNIAVIWEHDWKKLSNKSRYIEKLIRNGYGNEHKSGQNS